MLSHPLWRLVRQVGNVVAATCAALAVLVLCATGFGSVPALGLALDPGHGAWTSASGGQLPAARTLRLAGLRRPVTVSFDSSGIASIAAASETDAMLALGYVHATFRLTQMDLERRQAEGTLAQLAGPSAIASDEFELRLGLLRTAKLEWARMPKNSLAAKLLLSYSQGVNDYLGQVRETKRWPAVFSLAGVYPADWTPVDSLAVQGDLTQELDYTGTPLDYAVLARSLGMARTMAWFPVLPAGKQSPYDPGPYRSRGVAPLGATTRSPARHSGAGRHPGRGSAAKPAASRTPRVPSAAVARAAASMLTAASTLPAGQFRGYPDGSAWAANGPRVLGGGAMLAGDPHLPQTLPPAWYEVGLSAPGYDVTGVSVPGLPGVLIGHNDHIAWSLAGTQNQAALFYVEKTSKSRPGRYFWRGQWRPMRKLHYTIGVRGQPARQLTVSLTVHGPVMTQAGQTVSVDWMGNAPSPDVAVLQEVSTARNFAQFRSALASWRAPAQTFVYADDRGNIGAISAGLYPIVSRGTPWLPLPGTGADDVCGVIPYAAVPQSYDPPGHVIATASQRPVTSAYPYYIGTTANSFDASYRASREYAFLRHRSAMTVSSFAALQSSNVDDLAARVVPAITAMLKGARLTPMQQRAAKLLSRWNDSMDANSAAAAIWWTVWSDYLSATFEPWWKAGKVPVHLDPRSLSVSVGQASLVQVLEQWTLADQANPAFSPPGESRGTAVTVLRGAFAEAVSALHAKLGGEPSSWTWGKLHSRQFPSLTRAPRLGYGPRAAGGDPWTVDAADGVPVATAGPSWRMIVRWAGARGKGHVNAAGIYPGGQSENPASPWYENLIADWWDGTYLPLPSGAASSAPASSAPASSAPAGGTGHSTKPGGTPGSAPAGAGSSWPIRWELLP
ncbi:MAG TPA: penicillin acylase family protein [Streptosporangiaceae bacterium]|nr:penicillin acylase family protein [Streptosporangiaceae bacterium]